MTARWPAAETHCQAVDAFRKSSNLPHGAFRVVHLQNSIKVRPQFTLVELGGGGASHLLQLLLFLVGLDSRSLEVSGRGHVHWTNILVAVVGSLFPQCAEASEGQTSGLLGKRKKYGQR